VSATIGYCRSERAGPKLYVFSTNAEPFEAEKSYSKFEAFTLLNHGGDYRSAVRELVRQGYGERRNGPGDAAQTPAEGVPDGLPYREGDFTLAKQRTKWRVIVTRGEEVVGAGVANLADAKSRRDLIRSLKNVTPAEAEALEKVLLRLVASIERDWAEHQRRAAERFGRQQQERAERAAAEAAERRCERLREVESAARPVLADPTLLYRVGQALRGRGLVGEDSNALLLYLCVVSQVTDQPISAVVKGDSSAGKPHLVKTVLEAVPEAAHIDLTSMSEKALIYDQCDYAHRTVVIYEVHGEGNEFTTYLIRSLISEGEIRHLTVESTPLGPDAATRMPVLRRRVRFRADAARGGPAARGPGVPKLFS
jgi:hypothetical protein